MKLNTTDLAKQFISSVLKKGDFAIDATMGRGNDTVLLCELVGKKGTVLAFDIQQEAINSTKERLAQNNLENTATLILDSHENLDKYANENTVDLIVFNLGYLPKGNHNISTTPITTINALKKAMKILKINGHISLCIYQGGDTGFLEKDMIFEFLKNIDYKKFTVLITEFYNRPNFPPIFVKITKDM